MEQPKQASRNKGKGKTLARQRGTPLLPLPLPAPQVTMGNGAVVPATPSGRPRLFVKLFKLITLLCYTRSHRKVAAPKGVRPTKYTMTAAAPGGGRGWWSDAKNWRHMAASMWPDMPIPDDEH